MEAKVAKKCSQIVLKEPLLETKNYSNLQKDIQVPIQAKKTKKLQFRLKVVNLANLKKVLQN